jgi:hypothetical protein
MICLHNLHVKKKYLKLENTIKFTLEVIYVKTEYIDLKPSRF